MHHNSNLHPQWISGISNVVADCLSRDFDCPDMLLTKILFHLLPSQMPQAFEIAPLPREISSWLTCVLQKLPDTTQWCKGRTRSTTLHGLAGSSSVKALDWATILSSTTSPDHIASTSSSHSRTQYTADDIVKKEWLRPFRAAQSKIPSPLYQRPFASTIGPTPQLTSMEKLSSFYNANGEHMPIQTDNKNHKKPLTSLS